MTGWKKADGSFGITKGKKDPKAKEQDKGNAMEENGKHWEMIVRSFR